MKNEKTFNFYLFLLINIFDKLYMLINLNIFLNKKDRKIRYRLVY